MTPTGIEPRSPGPTKPMSRKYLNSGKIEHHHHHIVTLARISLTLSLATSPDRSLSLVVLQGYIPYPAVCMFELVVLLLLGHMWGSIGVHHL